MDGGRVGHGGLLELGLGASRTGASDFVCTGPWSKNRDVASVWSPSHRVETPEAIADPVYAC
eukprot:2124806-Pyramimonas_sp.AAC.1